MLLSIAMIVKNEEKNLERTLKAINSLASKINIEIIIVDTGSLDNTIEIAKKYTANVFEHKWIDNFAQMRNISLKYCKGEWVLILDGDEELINTDEIVRFFEEKLYMEYNAVFVKQMNMRYDGDVEGVPTPILRMFKNTNSFRYEGIIHEQPIYEAPVYSSNIKLLHDGYINSNYELMIYKYERNATLLKENLKKNPEDIYTLFQLGKSYLAYKKIDIALKYFKSAVDICKRNKIDNRYEYLYSEYSKQLLMNGYYEEAYDSAKYRLSACDRNIDQLFVYSIACIKLGKEEEALKYINLYIENVSEQKVIDSIMSTGTTIHFLDEKENILVHKMNCLFKCKRYTEVIKTYLNTDIQEVQEKTLEVFVKACFRKKDYVNLLIVLDKNSIDYKVANTSISILEKYLPFVNNDERTNILESLSKINGDIGLYVKCIYLDKLSEVEVIDSIKFERVTMYKAKMFEKCLLKEFNYVELLLDLNDEDIIGYLNVLLRNYALVKGFNNYSKINIFSKSIKKMNFLTILEQMLLQSDTINGEEYKRLLFRAITNRLSFMKDIFNIDVLQHSYNYILGDVNAFWYKLSLLFNKINDKYEAINEIKKMIEEYPHYKSMLKVIINMLDSNTISDEMKMEKENILITVVSLINQGNYVEAEDVLNEMINIFKFDYLMYNMLGVTKFLQGENEDALFNFAKALIYNPFDYESMISMIEVLIELNRNEDALAWIKVMMNQCENDEYIKIISEKRKELI